MPNIYGAYFDARALMERFNYRKARAIVDGHISRYTDKITSGRYSERRVAHYEHMRFYWRSVLKQLEEI